MKTAEDFIKELKGLVKKHAAAENELDSLKKILDHLKAALATMAKVSTRTADDDDMTSVELTIANLEGRQEILQGKADRLKAKRRQVEREFQSACKAALKK